MQVRAMQIIDELEVNKRGPYGGGMGYVAYNGNMDIALALRTMVIPNPPPSQDPATNGSNSNPKGRKKWTVHLQVCLVLSVVSCVTWLRQFQQMYSGCCMNNISVLSLAAAWHVDQLCDVFKLLPTLWFAQQVAFTAKQTLLWHEQHTCPK